MKKLAIFALILSISFTLAGCGATTNTTEESGAVIPEGAVLSREGNEILLAEKILILPDGMAYGWVETESTKSYYAWKSDTEFLLPTNHDVMLYVYEGEDFNSPESEIDESQAKNSIVMGYLPLFAENVDTVRFAKDAVVTQNGDWYTLCFSGYSGTDYITTTYGTICYPKSYYGIFVINEGLTEQNSRRYYGFVFSNNSIGEILSATEYSDLLGQIKDIFGLKTFYTAYQNPTLYDAEKDTSTGYSYSQFKNLFHETKNYYIVANGGQAEPEVEPVSLSTPYDVVRVVDGDTLVVSIDGKEVSVRLIGVDTPESVNPNESKNSDEGIKASEWTTDFLKDKKVCLEYDVEREDTYGRTLAYVYLEDGKTMVNRTLLENGLAQTMTIQPNSKYAEDFYAIQVKARVAKKGFWGTGYFSMDKKDES